MAAENAPIPPANLDAEESVLGAMMLSGAAVEAVNEILQARHFYRESHGKIFQAAVDLYMGGQPVDAITVADRLDVYGQLEEVGGKARVHELAALVPAASNAAHYAGIVEEMFTLRGFTVAGERISRFGWDRPAPIPQMLDDAERLIFEMSRAKASAEFVSLRSLLGTAIDELAERHRNPQDVTGLATGYKNLDALTGGLQAGNLVILAARPSMGKALSLDAKVLTPTGWTTMGDLRLGDSVIGADGHPDVVTGVYDQGERDLWRVTLADGSSVECCDEHLWLTRTRKDRQGGRSGTPKPLSEIRASLKRQDSPAASNHSIPYMEPARLAGGSPLPIDPYWLGLYLGDGHSAGSVVFSNPEPDLQQAFADALNPQDITCAINDGLRVKRATRNGDESEAKKALARLGLSGLRSYEKFIPEEYLRSSIGSRLALLQGLCDTDGFVTTPTRNSVEISTASPSLRDGILFLVGSLGGRATYQSRPSHYTKDGKRYPAREAHRIVLAFPPGRRITPVRSDKHLAKWRATSTRGRERMVQSVEPAGRRPCRCITVTRGLYVTNGFMVTHNSALGLCIAANVAIRKDTPVAVFTLEMSRHEVTQRFLSTEGFVESNRIRSGRLDMEEWKKVVQAAERLDKAEMMIYDDGALTMAELRSKARRLKLRYPALGLIVVDYLQLMTSGGKFESRVQEVSQISRMLKVLAGELQIPILALSQLSRQVEQRHDKRPILSDLRESGCLPASTRISRADTGEQVPLGELVAGEETPLVWALNEQWKLVPRRVTRVFPTGTQLTYRVRLASGYEIAATANHPFRTYAGWRPLGSLAIGDYIAVPRQIPDPQVPAVADDDALLLLAHMLGNGTFGSGFKYATADPVCRDAVAAAAGRMFGITAKWPLYGNTWQGWFPSPYRLTRGRHHPMRAWSDGLGLWMKRARDKSVPPFVFGLPAERVAFFLRHLWATDGSITLQKSHGQRRKVAIYYSTSSLQLAHDVRHLLLRVGILSRLRQVEKPGHHPNWHVHVTGKDPQMRFLNEIGGFGARGLAVPAANDVLAGVSANTNVDLLPPGVSAVVRSEMDQRGVSFADLSHALGEQTTGGYVLGGGPGRQRRLSRARARRIAEHLSDDALRDLATSDVFWDEIVGIAQEREEPTYDLTVEGEHSFVADGVIVHNSIEQDADVVIFLYRDEYYHPDETDQEGIAEVNVAKHRNGPTGMVKLAFVKRYVRFSDLGPV